MPGPSLYRHKPTTVEAMQFTSENWIALRSWLHYGGVDFQITPTHLLISTTQGDSRDIGLGGWVIKRKTPDGYEFYPVEAEVMNDYEDADGVPVASANWWITTGPLGAGGAKVLGPFESQELALKVRVYVEHFEAHERYWVDDEPAGGE